MARGVLAAIAILYYLILIPALGAQESIDLSTAKLVAEDFAVFKVGDTTYLYSDLLELDQQLKLFACTFASDSLLLSSLNSSLYHKVTLTKIPLGKIKSLDGFLSDDQKRYVDYLVFVLKAMRYVQGQGVILKSQLYKSIETMARANKCFNSERRKWLKNGLQLVQVEVYLKSRFREDAFWISDDDIVQFRSRYPGKSDAQIRGLEKDRKINESIKVFYDSLNTQILHEKF